MKTKATFLFILLHLLITGLKGQETIALKNASFEENEPACCVLPDHWINLGAADQTPPDIQPGFFQVVLPAQDGKQYIGLVVRENNTWEGVGQVLDDLLLKDSFYTFSLWLARSIVYRSATRLSTELVNHNAPTILKIWGYNTKTQQEELLAESQPMSHSQWIRYEFVLNPKLADYNELDLMAYYAPGHEQKNGNLLIDNCSIIEKINK